MKHVDPQGVYQVSPAVVELHVRARPWVLKTSQDAGKVHDVRVVVGGDGLALCVDLHGPIRVEHVNPDGEELHDLPRQVLVGEPLVVRVRGAPRVRQVAAHDRAVDDLAEDVPEVAKGVAHKDVVEVQPHLRLAAGATAQDEDLRERPGRALPQLVLRGNRPHRPDRRPREPVSAPALLVVRVVAPVVLAPVVEGELVPLGRVVRHLARRAADHGVLCAGGAAAGTQRLR
mmetsp:Transcript_42354/g.131244  ORF Transcript_42354/g.131244 Transcript_42354/m.131244 type:complete len:230 (+) Transcript_42354:3-692(+)